MKNKENYTAEKHQIKKNDPLWKELDTLSYRSKNLYNQALYRVRQHYFNTRKYLSYNEVQKQLQKENQIDYVSLNTKLSQLVLKNLNQNFLSYFASIKTYKTDPSKYKAPPKVPGYLDKKGRYLVEFNIQTIGKKELRNKILKLSGTHSHIKIQNDIIILNKVRKGKPIKTLSLKSVKVVPCNDSYEIIITHELPIKKEKSKEKDPNKCGAIDLGVNNLATVTTNIKGVRPFIINGRPVKFINAYYNKSLSELKSEEDKTKSKRKKKRIRREIEKLTRKRNNKINDYMHKSSTLLVNQLDSFGVSTIVIGRNEDWKQEINIGSRSNQNFYFIPHYGFIKKVQYKSDRKTISVKLNEESYTSKCSFLDFEEICKHENYLGRRIRRGLFKSSEGLLINADVAGSGNILRKGVAGALSQWERAEVIQGFVVSPVCLTIDDPRNAEDLSRIYRLT
jgi:putative transposase